METNTTPTYTEADMDEAVFPTEDAIAAEDWEAIAQFAPDALAAKG